MLPTTPSTIGDSAAPLAALPSVAIVVALYSADLFRFAWSLVAQQADAEDLVQQTLLSYVKKSHTIREPEKLKSWLFAVLHREHLRQRQKAQRFSDVPLDLLDEKISASSEESPSADATADHDAVITALEKMEDQLRSPLVLFYLKELKYREIAEILGLPIGTVMSRISRGKAALRNLLGVSLSPLPSNLTA